MYFGYTIIYVPDVEAALSFYELAFDLVRLFLHESKQYGELDTGSTKLAFASESLAKSNDVVFVNNRAVTKAAGFEIAFVTDDVLSAYKKAVAVGAIAVKEPHIKPWGQTISYVRDLNGVLIEICSPIV